MLIVRFDCCCTCSEKLCGALCHISLLLLVYNASFPFGFILEQYAQFMHVFLFSHKTVRNSNITMRVQIVLCIFCGHKINSSVEKGNIFFYGLNFLFHTSARMIICAKGCNAHP